MKVVGWSLSRWCLSRGREVEARRGYVDVCGADVTDREVLQWSDRRGRFSIS